MSPHTAISLTTMRLPVFLALVVTVTTAGPEGPETQT